MASNPPGDCCIRGVKHEGTTRGESVKINNKHLGYLAKPPSATLEAQPNKKDTAILFVPDVIGIWLNSKLMADQYAANGYLTLVIDPFNGDPLSLSRPAGFDFMAWLKHGTDGDNPHTEEAVDPIIEAAIKYLKEELGVKRLGAVGYCFGAKYVARHSKTGIQCGYFAHPSFVTEDELRNFNRPLSIAAAETDEIFTIQQRHASEAILRGVGKPYQINLFSGVAHGFAVRGDPNDKRERFAKEQAFIQAVAWFDQFLLTE
ncbi:dienelactone hydrolase [Hypomontagnella monticulosa]|nr:dienelactone hydrolase [Hypomontagnella monticulosa]